jgi:predicted RNase H-like nuclease (RuvC/YqgF family)
VITPKVDVTSPTSVVKPSPQKRKQEEEVEIIKENKVLIKTEARKTEAVQKQVMELEREVGELKQQVVTVQSSKDKWKKKFHNLQKQQIKHQEGISIEKFEERKVKYKTQLIKLQIQLQEEQKASKTISKNNTHTYS